MRHPDALLIGYKKAGTTFLRNYFEHHPAIEWTRYGGYFINQDRFKDVYQSSYSDLFKNVAADKYLIDMNEQLSIATIMKQNVNRLDSDVELSERTVYPNPYELANSIKKELPDVKIIMVLREQIDWISSYLLHHLVVLPSKKRTFSEFIATPEGKSVLYAGLFDNTIRAYQHVFGNDKIFVIPLEEIKNDPQSVMNRLCTFLGIEEYQYVPSEKGQNKGIGSLSGKFLRLASFIGISDEIMKKFKPIWSPLREKLRKIDNDKVLSKKEIEMLRAFYAASNVNTISLINTDLKQLGYAV